MTKKEKDKLEKDKIDELRKNPINDFTCLTCKGSKPIDLPDFKKHLEEVHGVTKENMKGNKKMILHMDGDMWFSSQYEWTLESGVKFIQYTEMARDRPMMG
jgi:hypothetical protein